MLKVRPGCLDDLFRIWYVSYGCHLFIWVWDSFCEAAMFCLPYHRSKTLWAMAIRCNFICCSSLFISMSLSVLVVCNAGWSPVSTPLLAQANCLTMTFSRIVSPVVFVCIHQITSRASDPRASTLTGRDMRENISCTTLERLAYIQCHSSSCCHHWVISGNQNVQQISIASEW